MAIETLGGSAVGGVCGGRGLPRASCKLETGLKAWGLRKRTDQPALEKEVSVVLGRDCRHGASGLQLIAHSTPLYSPLSLDIPQDDDAVD